MATGCTNLTALLISFTDYKGGHVGVPRGTPWWIHSKCRNFQKIILPCSDERC